MALKFLNSLMTFALLLSVSTAIPAVVQPLSPDAPALPLVASSGATLLDMKNCQIIEIAKYAIDQFNKKHNLGVVYSGVVEAIAHKDPQAEETYYDLIVEAKEKDLCVSKYGLVVSFEKNDDKLVVFKENAF